MALPADAGRYFNDKLALAAPASMTAALTAGAITSVAAWTGTAVRTTKVAYAGATVSASYVQAEAQATDNAVKAASQALKALMDDLRTRGVIA